MKRILISSICLLALINIATAQCNNNTKIISPVSPKPTDSVVSLTCSSITIKWKGQTDQSFVVTIVEKTQAYKILDTITTKNYSFDGSYYSSTINLKKGKLIYWAVEAITAINNINYCSYALRGSNEVPACAQSIAVTNSPDKSNALSVTSKDQTFVKIYPNPVQSVLNIEFRGKRILKASISIYDINGKLLLAKIAEGNTQLDVKQLTAGTYLIKINDENGKELYSGKVIKQ